MEHDESWKLSGKGTCVDVIFLSKVSKPSNINLIKYINLVFQRIFNMLTNLPKLEIRQSVLIGQFREDGGKVNTSRRPGSVEGHHPGHVLVPVQLLGQGVASEVDNVLWTLVGGLRKQESLEQEEERVNKTKSWI